MLQTNMCFYNSPEETAIGMGIAKHKHAQKNKVSFNFVFGPKQTFETVDHEDSVLLHVFWNTRTNIVLRYCGHVVTVIWKKKKIY